MTIITLAMGAAVGAVGSILFLQEKYVQNVQILHNDLLKDLHIIKKGMDNFEYYDNRMQSVEHKIEDLIEGACTRESDRASDHDCVIEKLEIVADQMSQLADPNKQEQKKERRGRPRKEKNKSDTA